MKKRKDVAVKIREQLVEAYRGITPGLSSDLRRDIVKNLTYVYLYPDETSSDFEEAIRYGEEYLFDPRHLPSGGLLVNLACAYGQKATWIKGQVSLPDKSEAEIGQLRRQFDETRRQALASIKEALRIDSTWKARFRELLQNDGGGRHRGDNDLQTFETDAEFRQLLDLPPLAANDTPGNNEPPRPPSISVAPTNCTLTRIADGKVTARWEPAPGADSYLPFYKVEGQNADWIELPLVTNSDVSIDNLPVTGTLKFCVQARNAAGDSPKSAVAEIQLA